MHVVFAAKIQNDSFIRVNVLLEYLDQRMVRQKPDQPDLFPRPCIKIGRRHHKNRPQDTIKSFKRHYKNRPEDTIKIVYHVRETLLTM